MHTPGPWEIRKGNPETENHVANVRGIDMYGPYSAASCNDDAHLIAAAPDLLAACEALLASGVSADELRLLLIGIGGGRVTDGLFERCDAIAVAMKQARAAIVKARGTQS